MRSGIPASAFARRTAEVRSPSSSTRPRSRAWRPVHTRPRATVYHVLGTLERAGLLLVADAGRGRTLYEAATHWHHHLVCRGCGAIIDVACLSETRPCLEPELPGALVEEAQVIFRGLCPACADRYPAS